MGPEFADDTKPPVGLSKVRPCMLGVARCGHACIARRVWQSGHAWASSFTESHCVVLNGPPPAHMHISKPLEELLLALPHTCNFTPPPPTPIHHFNAGRTCHRCWTVPVFLSVVCGKWMCLGRMHPTPLRSMVLTSPSVSRYRSCDGWCVGGTGHVMAGVCVGGIGERWLRGLLLE